MTKPHLIVVGGGLAGMSAGCYALRSGFRVTIVEHNLALGGVCTAWKREKYTIDGCIHWLTGGAFTRLYEELGLLQSAPAVTLEHFARYRGPNWPAIDVTRDLGRLTVELTRMSPVDADELSRLYEAARTLADMNPGVDAVELTSLREQLRRLWDSREAAGAIVHFRKSIAEWAQSSLQSPELRRFFLHLIPAEAPALFLAMILGYLERGYLSRPRGGTAAFRDALEHTYRSEGGEVVMPATVDEILVEDGVARGVRLGDGTLLLGDYVLSTASSPETVLRLLGGRFEAWPTRERLEHWKLFDPIVLVSLGLDIPLTGEPALQLIDGVSPLRVGGVANDSLYVRVCNDDPSYAPVGHSVLQVSLRTHYDWWATRGSSYGAAKDEVAQHVIEALTPYFTELRPHVRVVDVATPLTFWSMARSWRGAYEGWMPDSSSLFAHPKKTLDGLRHFAMAGQWLEPGGGIPMAVMSGRQAVQLLCDEAERPFVAQQQVHIH